MSKKNLLYAQSGGVTAVINATAAGVIETARTHTDKIGKVFAGLNGITGVLREEIVDTAKDSDRAIGALRYTPSGAYGSCRYKLQDIKKNASEFVRLVEVFKAHNIGYFLYNGGGDSQDTTHKVSQLSREMGFPITCIGIPKTVDNDLAVTDNCPGYGSVAKYVAVSTLEASFDVASMCDTSTKVFILEVMGRHAGWIAAASGVISQTEEQPPHIILLPEVPFKKQSFLRKVKEAVTRFRYCVIVASEGTQDRHGNFIAAASTSDAFGHFQLGGVAPALSEMIKQQLGFKCHWAVADYLQRSARHIASQIDVEQAYSLGCAAVEFAMEGKQAVMATIVRKSTKPYQWTIGSTPLHKVANKEKKMPKSFIRSDGFHITPRCRNYIKPLIQGEAAPPYKDGLPQYVKMKNVRVKKKLPDWKFRK